MKFPRWSKVFIEKLKSRWVFALFGIPFSFLIKNSLMEKFSIPQEKSSIVSLPIIFILGVVYVFVTDDFSQFKNRRLGFLILLLFTILGAATIGVILDRGLIPMPRAGDTWYDLLIFVFFFLLTLKLTDWTERLISEIFSRKK